MTALTRRRNDNDQQETWQIYFGDVRVGTISQAAGVPMHTEQWWWTCGFYPGMDPGTRPGGSAMSFEAAREAFETAWTKLLPTLSEAQFEEWRSDRDFHAWKLRMSDEKLPLPTQRQNGRSVCFCGVPIGLDFDRHVQTAHRGIGA